MGTVTVYQEAVEVGSEIEDPELNIYALDVEIGHLLTAPEIYVSTLVVEVGWIVGLQVETSPATVTFSAVDPTVETGSEEEPVEVTPDPVTANFATASPGVQECVYLSPVHAAVSLSAADPGVQLPANISPAAVSVVLDAIDPTYQTGFICAPATIALDIYSPIFANISRHCTYNVSAEDFAAVTGPKGVGVRTNQRLEMTISRRNASETDYWEWAGTWNDFFNLTHDRAVQQVTVEIQALATDFAGLLDDNTIALRVGSGTGPSPNWDQVLDTWTPTVDQEYIRVSATFDVPEEFQNSNSEIWLRLESYVSLGNDGESTLTHAFDNFKVHVLAPTTESFIFHPGSADTFADTLDPDVFEPIYYTPVSSDAVVTAIDPFVQYALYIFPDSADSLADTSSPGIYIPLVIFPEQSDLIVSAADPDVYNPLDISGLLSDAAFTVVDPGYYYPLEITDLFADFVPGIVKPIITSEQYFYPVPAIAVYSCSNPDVLAAFEWTPESANSFVDTVVGSIYNPLSVEGLYADVWPSVKAPIIGVEIGGLKATAETDVSDPLVVIGVYLYPEYAPISMSTVDPTTLLGDILLRLALITYLGKSFIVSTYGKEAYTEGKATRTVKVETKL